MDSLFTASYDLRSLHGRHDVWLFLTTQLLLISFNLILLLVSTNRSSTLCLVIHKMIHIHSFDMGVDDFK